MNILKTKTNDNFRYRIKIAVLGAIVTRKFPLIKSKAALKKRCGIFRFVPSASFKSLQGRSYYRRTVVVREVLLL